MHLLSVLSSQKNTASCNTVALSAGRWKYATGLLLLAALAASSWLVVASNGKPSSAAAQGASVRPGVNAAELVLRHPDPARHISIALFRSQPEEPSRKVRKLVSLHNPYLLKASLAQRLHLNTADPVWAVPGRGLICILDYNPKQGALGTSCDSTERVTSHGLVMTRLFDPKSILGRAKRVIFGIVPDGVRTVYIHTDSTVVTASVHRNTFFRQDSAPNPPDQVDIYPKI